MKAIERGYIAFMLDPVAVWLPSNEQAIVSSASCETDGART